MSQTKTISDQRLKLMLPTHVQEKLIAPGREEGKERRRGYYFCQPGDRPATPFGGHKSVRKGEKCQLQPA